MTTPMPLWNAAMNGRLIDLDAALDMVPHLLPVAVPVDVSNVAAWTEGRPQGKNQLVHAEDGLTCPWSVAWIEFQLPDSRDTRASHHAAMLVGTIEQRDREGVVLADEHSRLQVYGPFFDDRENQARGPLAETYLVMSPDGRIMSPIRPHLLQAGKVHFENSVDLISRLVDACLGITLWSFRFANCRNVELREVLPTRQQRRLAERRGEPIHTYHELVINPNLTKRSQGMAGKPGPSQGLVRQHICRGHFATYSEERPLFGKYAGRFWVPATVKGNPERGVVDKDYRIGQIDESEAADARA